MQPATPPSIDDGLDDVGRALLGAMADAGAVRPARHRKTTRLLALAVGEHPPRDAETRDRMRAWLGGPDAELRAAAAMIMTIRPIDEELVAAGRAWRSIDDPVVAAYARLADLGTPWRARVPLVDLQGNFGSPDGDPPADHLYTECRLAPWGSATLVGATPNLLVNGALARDRLRAVHFLPHEPGEVVESIAAHLAGSTPPPLAPDFPTGGVLPDAAWRTIARDGRGSLRVHARTHVEERNGARLLVVTEVPFLVDQREPVEQAARCMRDGRVTGLMDVLDESSREGMRLVFVLTPGAETGAVTAALLTHTSLAATIEVDGTAVVDGAPRLVTEAELIERTASRLVERTRQRMPAADVATVRDTVVDDLRALVGAYSTGRRTVTA